MNDIIDVFIMTVCLGIIILILYIICSIHYINIKKELYINNITSDNLYDLVMTKSPFDIVNISNSIEQKEDKLDVLRNRLYIDDNIDIRKMSSQEIIDVLQKQLGFDYEPKYYNETDEYIEVVMQYTGKMYGILIVIPKQKIWKPDVIGIIFDDKINMFMGAKENISSEPQEYPI